MTDNRIPPNPQSVKSTPPIKPESTFDGRSIRTGDTAALGSKQTIVPRGTGASETQRLMSRTGDTQKSFLMRNLMAYQEKNPEALIVLESVNPEKEGFVHPIFAYSAFDADKIKAGDKVHFIRSLKNLVKDTEMPYTDRWLGALCLLGLPGTKVSDQEKREILSDLSKGGPNVRNMQTFGRAIPSKEIYETLKALNQSSTGGPRVMQKIVQSVMKEAQQALKTTPQLSVYLEEDMDASAPDLSIEKGMDVDGSDMHLDPIQHQPSVEDMSGFGLPLNQSALPEDEFNNITLSMAEAEGMVQHPLSDDKEGSELPTLGFEEASWPPKIIDDYAGEGRVEGMSVLPEQNTDDIEDWVIIPKSIEATKRLMPEIVADVMAQMNAVVEKTSQFTVEQSKSWWGWGKSLVWGSDNTASNPASNENEVDNSSSTSDIPPQEGDAKPWKIL